MLKSILKNIKITLSCTIAYTTTPLRSFSSIVRETKTWRRHTSRSTVEPVTKTHQIKLKPFIWTRADSESVLCNAREPDHTQTSIYTNKPLIHNDCSINKNCNLISYLPDANAWKNRCETDAMKRFAVFAVQRQPPCRCAWATMNASPAHRIWNVSPVQSDDDKPKPLL